jgi:nitrate/nitrite transporter NarK
MLVAALGVGLAGGSFAVGIAYVSKWFPPEQQGTALGIFGAGNIGAAVTVLTILTVARQTRIDASNTSSPRKYLARTSQTA